MTNIETSTAADPADMVWRGEIVEEDETLIVAVVMTDGVHAPRFFYVGRWRETTVAFGYRIVAAWAHALSEERDEARAWVRRITGEERVLTCAFCGEAYPPGRPEANHAALTAHVAVCPKHPMRESEAARAALEVKLVEARAAGDALAARLEEGVEIVEGLVESARAGWESARLLAVAYGAHATERRAIEELAALKDAANGGEEPSDG